MSSFPPSNWDCRPLEDLDTYAPASTASKKPRLSALMAIRLVLFYRYHTNTQKFTFSTTFLHMSRDNILYIAPVAYIYYVV
jgi:hypothetical protein